MSHRTLTRRFLWALALLILGVTGWMICPPLPPGQVQLPGPTPLVSGLRLDQEPRNLLWSPDGRYLAILCLEEKGYMVVVDMREKRQMVRLPIPERPWPSAVWAADSRLWVRSKGGWEIYTSPFNQTRPAAFHKDGSPSEERLTQSSWIFRPDHEVFVSIRPLPNGGFIGNRKGIATDQLTIWKKGKVVYDAPFTPRESNDGQRFVTCNGFSADGTQLALGVTGWVAYETPGAEELWLLDVPTGKIRLLHVGKSQWWLLADFPVQSTAPSWSPDSRFIVFGDNEFGMETIDVKTGRRWPLLPSGWGRHPQAGRDWVAFKRSHQAQVSFFAHEIAVVSRDGRRWASLASTAYASNVHSCAWNKQGTQLALLIRDSNKPATYNLHLWQAP